MDFGWTVSALRRGFKVTRKSWKNSRFLWHKPATRVEAAWCHDPVLKQLAEQEGGIPATSTISCCFKDVAGVWTVTTGWVPQQFDLFAEDWMEWQTAEQSETDKLQAIRKVLDSIKEQYPDWLYVATKCNGTGNIIGYGFYVRDPDNPGVVYEAETTNNNTKE